MIKTYKICICHVAWCNFVISFLLYIFPFNFKYIVDFYNWHDSWLSSTGIIWVSLKIIHSVMCGLKLRPWIIKELLLFLCWKEAQNLQIRSTNVFVKLGWVGFSTSHCHKTCALRKARTLSWDGSCHRFKCYHMVLAKYEFGDLA